ncbi:hypothetical protein DPMN_047677 [Dreissena polymorpha]|uniref:Uncharacterized protein n=1 Tax=Dreissena polymorpha TaxID=45954 RepID=A0A9D4DA71_DREPO|nr:hypothetical protein DPMN_047677 [Dreissena polymorpha]
MVSSFGSERSFQLRSAPNVLKTVNGESMAVTGSVDLIVEMCGERFDTSFVVCAIEADGILGQDFLKQHVDCINYKRSCLMICNNAVALWTGGAANRVCRVECMHTISVPAHTRMSIFVKIPMKDHLAELGYVEPSFDLMAKCEVAVIDGIVDTTSYTLNMHFLNYGNSDVKIHKHTNLGFCESYFEHDCPSERIAFVQKLSDIVSLPDHLTDLYERSSTHLSDSEKQCLYKLLC